MRMVKNMTTITTIRGNFLENLGMLNMIDELDPFFEKEDKNEKKEASEDYDNGLYTPW